MKKYLKFLIPVAFGFLPVFSIAQAKGEAPSEAMQPAAILMFSVMAVLLFVIIILSKAVFAAYEVHRELLKNSGKTLPIVISGLLLLGLPAQAQEAADEVVEKTVAGPLFAGLSDGSFYMMISVIILELIIVFFLLRTFRLFLRLHKAEAKEQPEVVKPKKDRFAWLEKINNTKSVSAEAEAEINLGHDYDGIGELDNPTPPWWQWGFVISVIFAGVYLYTHHISKSAPNQIQELAMADSIAAIQQQAYLANSANNIDENSVTYLNEPADLNEGKSLFTSSCAPCHGADGGGVVGPNLTDEYWLHGGSVKDIFKTIKYGVPEKGMKSWKDDFTPKKIAQLASYIHSIKGTKPAAPKEPQGDVYLEETLSAEAK